VFIRQKSRALVGVDISASEVRLLQLKKRRRAFSVEKCGALPLPAGAVEDGKIKQLDSVQTVLKKLVTARQTQGAPAAMALPVSAVISKRVVIPSAAVRTLSTEQCQQYFPGVQDALCFDYALVGKVDNNAAEIFLIAARLESLHQYLALAEHVDLKIKIIDVDTYALARAGNFQNLHPEAFAYLHAALKLNAPRFMLCAALAMRELPAW
jgi:type IV pilus assembly protein PilM